MKKSEMLILLVACLMFALGMPSNASKQERVARQEEQAEEELVEDEPYLVTFKSTSPADNKISDIIWLKKAAQVALDAGIPYFNVLNQKTRKEFNQQRKFHQNVVEGEIKLANDPMNSEYDAHEIMSLVLTERP